MENVLVYQHRRLDTNEIFYIGIALVKSRPTEKSRRNSIWRKITNKTLYNVEIVKDNLSWDEACRLEIDLIKKYGRINLGTGTLANLTDGGDGTRGLERTKEHRDKLSKSQIGKIVSDETKRKISEKLKEHFKENGSHSKGKKCSEETKKLLSEIGKKREINWKSIEAMKNKNKGRNFSENHKQKLSEKAKQRPPMSDEIKEKISQTISRIQKGRVVSEETRKKISDTLKKKNLKVGS